MSRQPTWWPEGLWPALLSGFLLIGVFAVASASTPMPAPERWAALTLVALLALATTLQGSIEIYDALGRTVRRDRRALAALLALLPALYTAYATTVGEFRLNDLVTAGIVAALPALALLLARDARNPTIFDLIAVLYLALSVDLHLLPQLMLPQQGGLVRFFDFAVMPMSLLLFAARGWSGLGFSWFLSRRDLRLIVMIAVVLALPVLALAFVLGIARRTAIDGPWILLEQIILIYFFNGLLTEILYRGVMQNAAQQLLRARDPAPARAGWIALLMVALLNGLVRLVADPSGWPDAFLSVLISAGAGYAYLQSGKVTASAAVYAMLLWLVGIFGG